MDDRKRLEEDRALIEASLKTCFAGQNSTSNLYEAMEYSLLGGGKRIRPILTLETCRMCGGNPAQALPFAADKVARLGYADQALTLQLADAGAQAQRVAETPALIQQAASQGLKLERGDTDNTWRITRSQP